MDRIYDKHTSVLLRKQCLFMLGFERHYTGQLQWVAFHFGDASLARGNTTAGFPDFIVLSQLAAGLGLRGMAEQFRLQKRSAEDGGTMGHLIWQLQDNWPGT